MSAYRLGFTVYVSYYISKYIIPNYYPSRKITGNYKHTKILGFGQGEPSDSPTTQLITNKYYLGRSKN